MKWFYIYSDKYRLFHDLAQMHIPKEVFDTQPIYVEQSRFDKTLYQVEGKHPWQGCSIKLREIVRCIEEALTSGNNEPFLFTDIDMYIGNSCSELKKYMEEQNELDMSFMREETAINMGFVMIRPSAKTQSFWRDVLETLEGDPSNYMEQPLVWEKLQSFEGQVGFFPTKLIFSCKNKVGSSMSPSSFAAYHILSDSSSQENEIRQKLQEFYKIAKFLNDRDYVDFFEEQLFPKQH